MIGALFVVSLFADVTTAQLAQSEADFSGTQGMGGWYYGMFLGDADAGTPPIPSRTPFIQFDTFGTDWRASPALLDSRNAMYLHIAADAAHPVGRGMGAQGTVLIWPSRRFVSPFSGTVTVNYSLRSWNRTEQRATGVTGRVFIDGLEVRSHSMRNGFDLTLPAPLTVTIDAGTVFDFVTDSLGKPPFFGDAGDDPYGDRSDLLYFGVHLYRSPCTTDTQCAPGGCYEGACCNPAINTCPADAGTSFDAGVADAGVDAGTPDGGIDAGVEDGGASTRPYLVGCSCSGSNGWDLTSLAVLLVLAAWARHQRAT